MISIIFVLFYRNDSRVEAPERKIVILHIVESTQETRPVALCSRFRGS
jgi:hypothetical protein